jgi:hypothetical protein
VLKLCGSALQHSAVKREYFIAPLVANRHCNIGELIVLYRVRRSINDMKTQSALNVKLFGENVLLSERKLIRY